jgi:hypothetical protein
MIPPRNLTLKVSNQLLGSDEGVGTFLAADMPVIPFAWLIIEPQHAHSAHNIREPVFEWVLRPGNGFWYSPENQLGEGVL